jgi:hypothetical protein
MSAIDDFLKFLGLLGSSDVDPFPSAITVSFDLTNASLNSSAGAASTDPSVNKLCAAVVDLTGAPSAPAYVGLNDTDMLYVASVAKIYAMYAAFELKKRVEIQAKKMISDGLSTTAAGWETQVYDALRKAWQPKLNAAFPKLPQGFPDLPSIFVLSPAGDVGFAKQSPALTDAQLDAIDNGAAFQGKYRDWMTLMVAWSNDAAASKCILPLSYPYINGVLTSAGFFDGTVGLWLSGDYESHDWMPGPGNKAGQTLTPRWAKSQNRTKSNITGTALQLARFMTLLAQGKLVDSASSLEMIQIMTHPIGGARSFVEDALNGATPPRPSTSIASKIGIGDDSFNHDCAIVSFDGGADPSKAIQYVAVILGSPPANNLSDLRKLAVEYYDSIVAQHP